MCTSAFLREFRESDAFRAGIYCRPLVHGGVYALFDRPISQLRLKKTSSLHVRIILPSILTMSNKGLLKHRMAKLSAKTLALGGKSYGLRRNEKKVREWDELRPDFSRQRQ